MLKIILSVPVFIVLYLQNPKLRDFVAKEYFEKAVKKTSNEEVNKVGIRQFKQTFWSSWEVLKVLCCLESSLETNKVYNLEPPWVTFTLVLN